MTKINYLHNAFGIFITQLIIYPISILTGIIIAKTFGPAGKGILSYASLLTGFVLPVFMFGYHYGVLYYISSEKVDPRKYTITSILISGIMGGLVSAGIFILWKLNMLGKTSQEIPQSLFISLVLYMPLASVYLIMTKIINGIGWFSLNNYLDVIRRVVFLLLVIISVFVFHKNFNIIFYGYILSSILVLLVALIMIWSKFKPIFAVDLKTSISIFDYGIKSMIGSIANRMNSRMDQFILSIFTPPSQLGIYSVAVSVSEILWIIPSSIGPVLFKKISITECKDDKVLIIGMVHRMVMFIMFITALLFFILSIYFIPILYGDKFRKSIYILAIYLPGATLFVSRRIIVRYFGASGMPLKQSIDQVVGATLGILAYFVLVPHIGMYGAAVGSSLSYVASVIVIWYLYNQDVHSLQTDLLKLKKEDLIQIKKFILNFLKF